MKQIVADLQEELSNVVLSTQGTIPSWLSGTLVRNGPIMVSANGETTPHWFDGLAMLHAFTFERGTIRYSNQFLRTEAYHTVFDKGSIHYDGFATDPCRSLFKRFFTWFAPKTNHPLPNANINVAQIAKEYVALYETPLPVRFDPTTLATLGVLDYHDKLPKEKCWESAHPHRTPHATLNYLIQYGRTSYYILYSIPDDSAERKILARVPVAEPSYMHSFAMTEHYIIFTEFPFVVKPLDLLIKGKAFIHNFVWKPDRGTRFTVVSKQDGHVVGTYYTKPFFAFHHVNAYEKEQNIYLDIVCYDDPSIITEVADYHKHYAEKHAEYHTRLERFTLSLETAQLTSEILFDAPLEFPRIPSHFDGRPYRYVYLTDTRDRVTPSDIRPLYKFDTQTRENMRWSEPGCYPGEPVFVPSPSNTQEDDGLILSLIHTPHSSFLLILEAQTFRELGRVTAPHSIPPGLHGQFF